MTIFESLKAGHRKAAAWLESHSYTNVIVQSVLLTFCTETLSRRSLVKAALFPVQSPIAFLCNFCIICLTMSVSLLFTHRHRFVRGLVAGMWLALGAVDAVVLRFRMTPFTKSDFEMIPSLLRILKNYSSVIPLAVLGLAAVPALIVVLWKRRPGLPVQGSFLRKVGQIAGAGLCLALVLHTGIETQAVSTDFVNLADAYEEYGFAYCFTTSIVDEGIRKPAEYSEETMDAMAAGMAADDSQAELSTAAAEEAVRPNVIMIQLESFFDPTYIKDLTLSEDPIPNFRALKESGASGFLRVPVVGAGTANTEFEILTGMSTDCFGAGEYPYNTVLRTTTAESLAWLLKEEGYRATAIHNNTGTFYSRDEIFAQLGFDCFVSEEYMYGLSYTPNNWAKDDVLPGIITQALEASEEPDFIYTITVQSHGRYLTEGWPESGGITVSPGEDCSADAGQLEYYVNEIREVDAMIGELIAALEASGEPTVLVLYGDHLPAVGLSGEDLLQPDLYETEYVIWNNCGATFEGGSREAEDLGAYLLDALGYQGGILSAFHRTYDGADSETYSAALEMLEYDMLYGDGYIFRAFGEDRVTDEDGRSRAYTASDITFGLEAITVTSAAQRADTLYITGENFNASSRAVIDGRVMDTVYEDGLLVVSGVPEDWQELYVGQFDENAEELGTGSNRIRSGSRAAQAALT